VADTEYAGLSSSAAGKAKMLWAFGPEKRSLGNMDKAVRLSLVLLLAGLFGLSLSGCTRRFYRNRADL